MLPGLKKYGLLLANCILLVAVIVVFYLDFRNSIPKLTLFALDVGQGDAIFIQSPTGTQILIDAGPPRKVLGQLARVMPLFDRRIEAIVITNPDLDHVGGFLDVLKAYQVDLVIEPGTQNVTQTFKNLKNEIQNKKVKNILARKGMRLHLGGGAVVDILFPDRDVSMWATNEGSVVAKLTYGETSIMLTGDATSETEKIILGNFPKEQLDVDILKVGHHGSRTSTIDSFARALSPEYAIISSGKGNNYGHPHQDVLGTLEAAGAKILRTDTLGTIVFSCDRMGACETN